MRFTISLSAVFLLTFVCVSSRATVLKYKCKVDISGHMLRDRFEGVVHKDVEIDTAGAPVQVKIKSSEINFSKTPPADAAFTVKLNFDSSHFAESDSVLFTVGVSRQLTKEDYNGDAPKNLVHVESEASTSIEGPGKLSTALRPMIDGLGTLIKAQADCDPNK